MDTTDPTTGTFGQNLNFEAIQEVSVYTTGPRRNTAARRGRTSTSSPSPARTGRGPRRNTDRDQRQLDYPGSKGAIPDPVRSFARIKTDKVINDWAYTLGGPVWQDHIWFFGAYEHVNRTSAQTQTATSSIPVIAFLQRSENYRRATNTRLWDGKLSAQVTPCTAADCAVQQRSHQRLRH